MTDDGANAGAQGAGGASTDKDGLPEIDFSTFVLSLSTSAMYQMGCVPDPTSGEPTAPNRLLAQQTIDTLKMLRRKTQGNLDDKETKLLDGLLYELRMKFVEIDR